MTDQAKRCEQIRVSAIALSDQIILFREHWDMTDEVLQYLAEKLMSIEDLLTADDLGDYLANLETTVKKKGYTLEQMGYSQKIQKEIDRLGEE